MFFFVLHFFILFYFFFFFSSRRRHTRSTRDWSSDVCSSDLPLSVSGWATRPALMFPLAAALPCVAACGVAHPAPPQPLTLSRERVVSRGAWLDVQAAPQAYRSVGTAPLVGPYYSSSHTAGATAWSTRAPLPAPTTTNSGHANGTTHIRHVDWHLRRRRFPDLC